MTTGEGKVIDDVSEINAIGHRVVHGLSLIHICAETPEHAPLQAAAAALCSAAFPAALRSQLESGLPFAAARAAARCV